MRRPLVLTGAAAVLASAGALALAAGDDDPPGTAASHALTSAELRGIPAPDRALALASDRWQRLARRPAPTLRGLGSAHPGAVSIRVSRSRAALTRRDGRQRFPYPRKTVVVKTGRVGGELTLVAIMRKVARGGDISNWRFVEYTRGGAGQAFTKVGGGQTLCSGCHVSATTVQRSDGVFYRLD